MRLGYGLLVGFAVLSGGCTAVPSVIGISGSDTVPLNTRLEVHDALGAPTARSATSEGTQFEEFVIQSGCDEIIWGVRVPAFQPLEEFHIHGWGDLQMITVSSPRDIPTTGKNLILVAKANNLLHFRIFDETGNLVVDTNETKMTLPAHAPVLADLKKQLESVWPPHKIAKNEKEKVITTVASLVGHIPVGSFELGVTTIGFNNMLTQIVSVPNEKDRHRVFPGQKLRFDYDHMGRVTKVYLNGELLLSPAMKPESAAITTTANAQPWWAPISAPSGTSVR